MTPFTVTVVERPAIRCAGLKIRTDMENAHRDCPQLWQERFGPRMADFPADPAIPGESYGISIMVDADNFDYWAAMPIAIETAVPEGMDSFTIPGGLYAECRLPSLDALGAAFEYIYTRWLASQDKYVANLQGVGYELYTCEYMQNGSLTVYCALLEK